MLNKYETYIQQEDLPLFVLRLQKDDGYIDSVSRELGWMNNDCYYYDIVYYCTKQIFVSVWS